MPDAQETVATLMAGLAQGDTKAARSLVNLFYRELHRLAASKMSLENRRHTWQPTALVNEVYVALSKIRKLEPNPNRPSDNKEAFLALSAHIMRRLLISHARSNSKQWDHLDLEALELRSNGAAELGELEATLTKLEQIDPKLRSVVELKVFGGLTANEIALRIHASPRSVARHWEFAKTWLQEALRA